MTVRLEQLLAAAAQPFPWIVLRDGDVVTVCTDDGEHEILPWNEGTEQVAEEHAALIALAPDMARLLIDMGEWARAGRLCPEHGIPDCSPLLNGCSLPNQRVALLARLDALGKDTA